MQCMVSLMKTTTTSEHMADLSTSDCPCAACIAKADAFIRNWRAARARGDHAKLTERDGYLFVEGAPSYEYAKRLATAFLACASLATGVRKVARVTRERGRKVWGHECWSGTGCSRGFDGYKFLTN